MQTDITTTQQKVLKEIVGTGKVETKGYNGNTLIALERRGLVKLTENKKGKFVQSTAKGKKALN